MMLPSICDNGKSVCVAKLHIHWVVGSMEQ